MGAATQKMWAGLENGNLDMVGEAVLEGADVNHSTKYKTKNKTVLVPPLLIASEIGVDDLVRLMLRSGAKVGTSEETFLNFGSITTGKRSFVGKSSLHAACQQGHVLVVQTLLDAGADINQLSVCVECVELSNEHIQTRLTPLHFAAMNGHAEVVALLLARSAFVHIQAARHVSNNEARFAGEFRDGKFASALSLAAARGHVGIITMLLEHDTFNVGLSLDSLLVKYLLKKKTAPAAANFLLFVAACQHADVDLLRTLFRIHSSSSPPTATVSSPSSAEEPSPSSPLTATVSSPSSAEEPSSSSPPTATVSSPSSAEEPSASVQPSSSNRSAANGPASPAHVSASGVSSPSSTAGAATDPTQSLHTRMWGQVGVPRSTLLHIACWSQAMCYSDEELAAIVTVLLEHGADPNAQDHFGFSPLHFACMHGREKCVLVLLDAGASLGCVTHASGSLGENANASPLALAVRFNRKAVLEAIASHDVAKQCPDILSDLDAALTALKLEEKRGDFDVTSWLESISLPHYATVFQASGVTKKEAVVALTDASLADMGISMLGHRKILLQAVAQLKAGPSPAKKWIPSEIDEDGWRPTTLQQQRSLQATSARTTNVGSITQRLRGLSASW